MLFKKSNTSSKSLESFRLLCFKPNSNRSCINGIIEDFLTSSWGIFSNVGSFLLLLCHVIPRRGSTHRQRRLAWAQNHVNWTAADWTPVLFSDESRFCLDHTDGRAGVLHRPGERYQDACIVQHDRYGGGSLMVWVGIIMASRTDLLVLQQGSMTAQRYRDKVLDLHVRPYVSAIGDDSLMDDNAPPHRARIVQQYLQQETIVRMDWPARLPDCYPIEHLWDFLQVAVTRHQQQPRSLLELENSLVAEWNAVSQIHIQRLIRSMRRRCQAVISARGSHTRY